MAPKPSPSPSSFLTPPPPPDISLFPSPSTFLLRDILKERSELSSVSTTIQKIQAEVDLLMEKYREMTESIIPGEPPLRFVEGPLDSMKRSKRVLLTVQQRKHSTLEENLQFLVKEVKYLPVLTVTSIEELHLANELADSKRKIVVHSSTPLEVVQQVVCLVGTLPKGASIYIPRQYVTVKKEEVYVKKEEGAEDKEREAKKMKMQMKMKMKIEDVDVQQFFTVKKEEAEDTVQIIDGNEYVRIRPGSK